MPLSFEKIAKCIFTTMNVHSLIIMNMMGKAETKCKGYSPTSKVIIEEKRDYEFSCRNFIT